MKRLSVEEAATLIKADHNTSEHEKTGYTITPSVDPQKRSEGWEDVTYYTSIKRMNQKPAYDIEAQWIYVLTNASMPGLCKIGFTKNTPEERCKEINSATGVPVDYEVAYSIPVFNGHDVEQLIHSHLSEVRVNKRKEFFTISLDEVKPIIDTISQPYKMLSNE